MAVLCLSGSAGAETSFRCGTELISAGDTRNKVLQKCGEPTAIDSWEEERIQKDYRTIRDYDPRTSQYEWSREPFLIKITVKIELWTYNPGSTRFIRYLRFENGILKEITTGERGY